MPERIDLTEQLNASGRKAIDAEWSQPKKIAVISIAGVLATAGVAWGVWSFIASRPPSMPTTAEQAVLLLASNKFGNLDGERKEALRSEAVRLLSEASDEQREQLRETIELSEEGSRQLGQAIVEDMIRRFARGEDIDWSAMRGRRPGGARPEGDRPPGSPGEGRPERGQRNGEGGGGPGGDGPNGESRNDRREQMRNRIQERMASGNAQTTALFGEYYSRRRQQREQNRNNGNGGGGGGGGG